MSNKKNINLMAALSAPAEPVAEQPAPAPVAVARPQKAGAAKREKSGKGREGKKGLTFWLDPAFDETLAEIQHQARRSGSKITREEQAQEAFNDYFRKHKMPVVGQ